MIQIPIQGVSVLNFTQVISAIAFTIQDFRYKEDYLYDFNEGKADCIGCKTVLLNLSYLIPQYGRKILSVWLNYSLETIIIYNLVPTQENKTIQLLDYYVNDSSKDESIEQIKSVDQTVSTVTTSSCFLLAALKGNSKLSSTVRNIMVIEMVYLLKFIDLNYPQNLRQYFLGEIPLDQPIIYTKKFDKNIEETELIPKLYLLYGLGPYFLDNSGESCCRMFFFWGIAETINLLNQYIRSAKWKIKRKYKFWKYFMKFFSKFVNWIVWCYILFYFLGTFQEVLFKAISAFTYITIETEGGKLNLGIAVFFFILYISIVLFLIWIIKKKHVRIFINANQVFLYHLKNRQKHQLQFRN